MQFIKNFRQFLLENKKQSISILKKEGLDPTNPDYQRLVELCEKIFKNLNYLGLLTTYRFQQEVSMEELEDLLPWLRYNSNRLSKPVLQYKKFEELKDEIIQIDNKQKVKVIYDLLPREQKDLIKGHEEEFSNWAIELHNVKYFKEFGSKLSKFKTYEELIEYIEKFVESHSESLTYDKILNDVRENTDATLIKEDKDEGWILAEIKSFECSNKMGSPSWCISSGEGSWNSYVGNTRSQFFLWDFSLSRADSQFMVGFTTNANGQIIYIHDKNDKSLSGNIPNKIIELSREINFSLDPVEYREKIDKSINDGIGENIETNDRNIYLISVNNSSDLRHYEPESWSNIFPYNRTTEFNFYVIIDFNKDLNDPLFTIGIKYRSFEDNKKLEIFDLNEKPIKDVDLVNKFVEENKIIPKNLDEFYSELKDQYVKNLEEILNREDIKNALVDTDGKSKWLFRLVPKETWSSSDVDSIIKALSPYEWKFNEWKPYYNRNVIDRFNAYLVIDLTKSIIDDEMVMGIEASEKNSKIKFNNDSDPFIIGEYPELVKKYIESGSLVVKSEKEYNIEVSKLRNKFWEEVDDEYLDDQTELMGKILYEYLVEEGEIEENEDDKSDSFKRILIPQDYGYGGMKYFEIYSSQMYLTRSSGISSWMIGTDDEADEAAKEYQIQLLDDVGYGGLDHIVYHNIDSENFADQYADDEDYFREVIEEEPEHWNIEKIMKDGVEDEIDELTEEKDELDNKKEKAESKLTNYKNYIEEKINKIDEMLKTTKDSKRKDRLNKIKEKLKEREEVNIERYSNLIEEYDNLITDLQDKIDEREDENDDDYWEYDSDEIEREAKERAQSEYNEAKNDPKGYLENRGYDEDNISKILKDFIDQDGVIEDIISADGRAHGMSEDGQEREYYYEDEDNEGQTYYIYQKG